MRAATLRLALLLTVLVTASSVRPVAAGPPPKFAPVVVYALGPKTIKVRIAGGTTAPCDASANTVYWTGKMNKGEQIEIPFGEMCACVEHTYDDFPEVGWGDPILRCRPKICQILYGKQYCVPDTSAAVYLSISSTRPKT